MHFYMHASLCVDLCSPDQSGDPLCGYVEQLAVQNPLRVCTVSYECNHEQANVSFTAFLYRFLLHFYLKLSLS